MLALLIDGLNLVRRIEAAVPASADVAARGDGVVNSCARSLERALAREIPSHALCAFDAPGRSWRHELLPAYKAGRPPMPEAVAALLPRIEERFELAGVRCVRVPGYEADDVLATIAVKIATAGGRAVILSTDKSMLSLLRPGIRVHNHFEDRDLDAGHARDRFGVAPEQLTTWLALVGESSQGIPGIKGVGAKTAARLLQEHGSLEEILAAAGDMPGRLGERLREGAASARLSLELASLHCDVEVGINLSQCRLG